MLNAPSHPDLIAGTVAAPSATLSAPSHDDIVAAWAQHNADPVATAQHLGLSLKLLLELVASPAIAPLIEAWRNYRTAHLKLLNLQTQVTTTTHLCDKMQKCDDFTETRRAAAIILRWSPFARESTAPTNSLHANPSADAQRRPPEPLSTPAYPTASHAANLTANPNSDSNPDPRAVVARLVAHIERECDLVAIAQSVAAQLAPAATLDHKPVPLSTIDDPNLIAEIVDDSTIGDLSGARAIRIQAVGVTDTSASVCVTCRTPRALPYHAFITLSRDSASSPWLITSISSPTRPAPTPQSASP